MTQKNYLPKQTVLKKILQLKYPALVFGFLLITTGCGQMQPHSKTSTASIAPLITERTKASTKPEHAAKQEKITPRDFDPTSIQPSHIPDLPPPDIQKVQEKDDKTLKDPDSTFFTLYEDGFQEKIEFDPKHTYNLAQLIDLAQRTNPETRIAWLHAKQAATAAGMTRSAYLPFISAIAVAGYQKSHKSDRFSLLDHELEIKTRSSIRGFIPALTLEWLLFDFGKREAVSKAAHDMALASQFALGAAHQAVIFNVTQNYFQYANALKQLAISKENLKNAEYILQAAQANYDSGIGTSIEVAQAKQLKAQNELTIVENEGQVHSTRQLLLSAIGLAPNESLKIDIQQHALPTLADMPEDQALQDAVKSRPDIKATQATLDAAHANIKSAKANYYPKIALMGVTAGGQSSLNIQGLPTIHPRAASTGILLGVSIPIFDGGLRSMQLREARLEAQAAAQVHEKNEHDALKEMYIAGDALRTAIQAHEAAKALLEAAQTTYDAALESYTVGLTSMTLLSEAASGLASAKVAHHAAYTQLKLRR